MSHSAFDIRGNLIKQLLYFDDNFSEVLDKVPDIAEKTRLTAVTDRYRDQIIRILNENSGELSFSEVLIGCNVDIQYLSDSIIERYRIVLPIDSDVDRGCLSFLSPLGRSLLLCQAGDIIDIDSPAGTYSVQIINVSYQY